MRLKIMGVGLIVGASLLPGRAQGQVEPGCFDVSLGEWSPIDSTHVVDLPRPSPPDQSGDSVSYLIPPRLRLHDDRTAGRSKRAFLVSVPPNALQVPYPFLSWTGTSDSLRIALSTGYAGTISTLYPTTDGWTGTATTFSDVHGLLRYERPMTLHRVACESEPPVPASADTLPRSVELREHETLALGQPLPSGAVAQPRRSGAKTLEVEVAGIWAGADTVVVRIDEEGVVFHIEMRYPDGFDLSPLMQALLREFGPGRTFLGATNSASWRNRTTIMYAIPQRPSVVIRDPRYW